MASQLARIRSEGFMDSHAFDVAPARNDGFALRDRTDAYLASASFTTGRTQARDEQAACSSRARQRRLDRDGREARVGGVTPPRPVHRQAESILARGVRFGGIGVEGQHADA